MGDRCNQKPAIAWTAYETSVLLEVVGAILAVIADRVAGSPVPGISSTSAAGSGSSFVASSSSQAPEPVVEPPPQGLRAPWTCGFHCKYCTNPCTRKEGHSNHSCWWCRHKRH